MHLKVEMLGRIYGYPECCIEDFVRRLGSPPPLQKRASSGTGFIPCSACTLAVLSGVPLESLILPTRRAPPFPRNGSWSYGCWCQGCQSLRAPEVIAIRAALGGVPDAHCKRKRAVATPSREP